MSRRLKSEIKDLVEGSFGRSIRACGYKIGPVSVDKEKASVSLVKRKVFYDRGKGHETDYLERVIKNKFPKEMEGFPIDYDVEQ